MNLLKPAYGHAKKETWSGKLSVLIKLEFVYILDSPAAAVINVRAYYTVVCITKDMQKRINKSIYC